MDRELIEVLKQSNNHHHQSHSHHSSSNHHQHESKKVKLSSGANNDLVASGNHKKQQHNGNIGSSTSSTARKSVAEKEMVGGCVVCGQDEGYIDNALTYCDGDSCGIGVHQACYGITVIPSDDWYCTPCSLNIKPEKCELCPAKYGAFKPTTTGKWCHVVCALYIPEVAFGSIQTMEPIILDRIESSRIGCVCILCEMSGRDKDTARNGCCMSCHYPNCPNKFHVTCAQYQGFLCEEASATRLKYKAYCPQHIEKLRNPRRTKIKILPAYRPEDPNRKQSNCFLILNDNDNGTSGQDSSSRTSSSLNLSNTSTSSSSSVLVSPQSTSITQMAKPRLPTLDSHHHHNQNIKNGTDNSKNSSSKRSNKTTNGKQQSSKQSISSSSSSSAKKSAYSAMFSGGNAMKIKNESAVSEDTASPTVSSTTKTPFPVSGAKSGSTTAASMKMSLLSSPKPNESLTVPRKRTLSASSSSSTSSTSSSSSSSSAASPPPSNSGAGAGKNRRTRRQSSSSSEDKSSDGSSSDDDDSDDDSDQSGHSSSSSVASREKIFNNQRHKSTKLVLSEKDSSSSSASDDSSDGGKSSSSSDDDEPVKSQHNKKRDTPPKKTIAKKPTKSEVVAKQTVSATPSTAIISPNTNKSLLAKTSGATTSQTKIRQSSVDSNQIKSPASSSNKSVPGVISQTIAVVEKSFPASTTKTAKSGPKLSSASSSSEEESSADDEIYSEDDDDDEDFVAAGGNRGKKRKAKTAPAGSVTGSAKIPNNKAPRNQSQPKGGGTASNLLIPTTQWPSSAVTKSSPAISLLNKNDGSKTTSNRGAKSSVVASNATKPAKNVSKPAATSTARRLSSRSSSTHTVDGVDVGGGTKPNSKKTNNSTVMNQVAGSSVCSPTAASSLILKSSPNKSKTGRSQTTKSAMGHPSSANSKESGSPTKMTSPLASSSSSGCQHFHPAVVNQLNGFNPVTAALSIQTGAEMNAETARLWNTAAPVSGASRISRSQIPFNSLMIPCYGPNIAPTNLAPPSSPLELPPPPKTLEELLEFQWVHTAHFLMSREETKDASAMIQKLHGLISEKSKLQKELRFLQQKVQFFDTTLKAVKDMVALSKGEIDNGEDGRSTAPAEKLDGGGSGDISSTVSGAANGTVATGAGGGSDVESGSKPSTRPNSASSGQTPTSSHQQQQLQQSSSHHHPHSNHPQQASASFKSSSSGSSTPSLAMPSTAPAPVPTVNTSLSNILAATTLRATLDNGANTPPETGGSNSSSSSRTSRRSSINNSGIHSNHHQQQHGIHHSNSPTPTPPPPIVHHSSQSNNYSGLNLATSSTSSSSNNPVVPESYSHYLSKQLNASANQVTPHNLPPTTGFSGTSGYGGSGGTGGSGHVPPPPFPPPPNFDDPETTSSAMKHHYQQFMSMMANNHQFAAASNHYDHAGTSSASSSSNHYHHSHPHHHPAQQQQQQQQPPQQQAPPHPPHRRPLRSSTQAAAAAAAAAAAMANGIQGPPPQYNQFGASTSSTAAAAAAAALNHHFSAGYPPPPPPHYKN